MKKLTVAAQLAIGFGNVLALLLGILAFSVYQQNRLAELTEQQYRHPFAVSNAIARADANILRMARAMQDIVQSDNEVYIQKYAAQIDALEAEVQKDLALAKARFLGDKLDLEWLAASFREWKPVRSKVIELKRAGKMAAARHVMRTENAAALIKISALKTVVYDFAMNKAEGFRQNAAATRDAVMQMTLWIGLTMLLAGSALWLSIIRSLRRNCSESADKPLDAVGQGNAASDQLNPATRQNTAKHSPTVGGELEFVSF